MKRLLLLLFGIIALVLPAHAAYDDEFTYEYKGHTFIYRVTDENVRTCKLSSGRSARGAVELPEKPMYNGIPYTLDHIAHNAFYHCPITSIEIPNSVKSIGDGAFSSCTNLTSLVIPNSVQEIRDGVFQGCTGLIYVKIPNSVQEIGDYAFDDCKSLSSVVIPNSVKEIGKGVFEGCTGLIKSAYPNNIPNPFSNGLAIAYPDNGITIDENDCVFSQSTIYFIPYYIPDELILTGFKTLGDYSFALCSELTSVELPNSLTQIGASAFQGCTKLASIELPNSLTQIGESAFQSCTNLTSLIIPSSVQKIGRSTFENCVGLSSVELSNSVKEIGTSAFRGCTKLASIELPNSLTQIGANAFQSCTSLASIELPNSLTQIGANAFQSCTSLASIELPNSLTQTGESAFQSCTNLTSLVIPSSVQKISTSSFEDCVGLSSVELSNSVKEIGASAFRGCTKLTSIELPNSLTQIGESAFQSCSSLTSVIIPGSIQNIGTSAFEGCSGLIKSAYPDNISNPFSNGLAVKYTAEGTTIENGCLVGQSTLYFAPVTLSGVYTVPSTIKAIGDNAFALCKDITYIRMPSTLSSIGKNAFDGCNLYDFTIPNSVKVFDMGSLAGNPLKSLTVGSGVTQITGSEYFLNSGLEKIFWLGNIPPIGYTGFTPVVNFVSNDQYLLANQILYPFLSSIFEVDGIVYVPVSPSERTCNVVDYLYAPSNAQFEVPSSITNQGIQMKVIDVGAYAFYHHDYLTDISLDNNGAIDDYAFYDCLRLKSVKFGDNIPEIKNHTFQNCEVLERVENSPALISIGNWAFSGCVGMDYFSVGNKIKSFGEEAFSDCTGLTKFYTSATTPPECGAQALDDIIKWNCTLYVPEGSETLYASAPQWKDFFFIEGISGVEAVLTDAQTEAEIFDLNGIKQTKPIEDLTSGIYIIRQGSNVTKKLVK
ncbi:MAG: leucine-rich repeat domain-containing protein [Bacteroidales bacterium]|nr:leucine-rich repeat domain-containing protein [Bacteroidales bacterium]